MKSRILLVLFLALACHEEDRLQSVACVLEATADYRATHPITVAVTDSAEERFARGEITLATLEGRSREELYAYAEEAYAAFKSGDLQAARRRCETLVAYAPNDAYFQAFLGCVYQKSGRLEDAVTQYTESLRLNPRNTCPLTNRGESFMSLGKYADAVKDFRDAIALDPHRQDGWAGRARILLADAEMRANPSGRHASSELGFAKPDSISAASQTAVQAPAVDPTLSVPQYGPVQSYFDSVMTQMMWNH